MHFLQRVEAPYETGAIREVFRERRGRGERARWSSVEFCLHRGAGSRGGRGEERNSAVTLVAFNRRIGRTIRWPPWWVQREARANRGSEEIDATILLCSEVSSSNIFVLESGGRIGRRRRGVVGSGRRRRGCRGVVGGVAFVGIRGGGGGHGDGAAA